MPTGIYIRTKEYREKMSKLGKGRKHTEETKKKISESRMGEKHWFFGKHHSKETNEKNRLSHLGKSSYWNLGKPAWNKGRKMPEITGKNHPNWKGGLPNCKDCNKKLNSRHATGYCHQHAKEYYSGENSGHWRGGITPLYHQIRSCLEYRLWRSDIFRRDDFTCQECKIRGGKLSVDHIKPFAVIIAEQNIPSLEKALQCEELWDINNGRVLCILCHKKTDTYGKKTIKLINNLTIPNEI